MKRISQKRKLRTLPLAFAIPCVGMLIVMLICGYEPFGDSAILYSDNYHQYFPFFKAFREHLRSGGSLLWSWDVGLGMDYLGLISYYLASPLYLLSVIVPDAWVLEYYCLLLPVRLGLAGLFFAIFLKNTFHKDDISVALFSAFYALCAWALGYMWNVMWLDTFALTPRVVLGTVRVLEERKFILDTLTLFLAIYSNYYIGFFVCIFVMLVCICWEICRWRGFWAFLCDILLMLVFSVLAVGMSAVLELPALAALQNTQSSVNEFPTGFNINIGEDTWLGLLDAMGQVAGNMGGGLEPTFKEGLPNIYCGVGTLALAILYLMAREVKVRDKICAVAMLVFLMLSFIIRQLDYIWHGFHFTNMIPYRFSFLYSFVMLYMAYRAWTLRHSFRVRHVVAAGVIAAVLCAMSIESFEPVFLVYNGSMLALYCGFMGYTVAEKKIPKDADEEEREFLQELHAERRTNGALYLAIILCAELIMNLVNFGIRFPGTSVAFYPRGTEYSASMIRYMHEREWDEPFFRAEVTNTQTLNDGALNGYNGISTFTSSANVKVTEFMKRLGYGAKNTYNRYCFEESSPVSNLFLGIKYMLERSGRVEENPYFTDLHAYGDVHLLENNVYLPLGFLANSELANVDFSARTSDIDFQNGLFTAATGVQERVWKYIYGDCLTISATDADLNSWDNGGVCNYTTGSMSGRVNYRYVFQEEGFLCVTLDMQNRNNFTFYLNGNELYTDAYSIPQSAAVCQVHPGDVVDIALSCNANETGNITIRAGLLNEALFRQGYQNLAVSTLKLDTFESTYVSGHILCNRDGLLYTSIPQDGNWQVYVDGERAEPTLVADVMISIPLEKGEHSVEFIYHNRAFALGWKVSLLCSAALAALAFWVYPDRKKKGKYAQ